MQAQIIIFSGAGMSAESGIKNLSRLQWFVGEL